MVDRKPVGVSVCTIEEPRSNCSRSSVTSAAANSAAVAKYTASVPRNLCLAPSRRLTCQPLIQGHRNGIRKLPDGQCILLGQPGRASRSAQGRSHLSHDQSRQEQARARTAHPLKKVVLSKFPASLGRAALTNTLASMVMSRISTPHLLELRNRGSGFLSRLLGQQRHQRLPRVPRIIFLGCSSSLSPASTGIMRASTSPRFVTA